MVFNFIYILVLQWCSAAALVPLSHIHDSKCHAAMVKWCNATAGKGAVCKACEMEHKSALVEAGCAWQPEDPNSKIFRFCGGSGTPDCPNGPDHPCKEPATPQVLWCSNSHCTHITRIMPTCRSVMFDRSSLATKLRTYFGPVNKTLRAMYTPAPTVP